MRNTILQSGAWHDFLSHLIRVRGFLKVCPFLNQLFLFFPNIYGLKDSCQVIMLC